MDRRLRRRVVIAGGRLVVVSNRLPITIQQTGDTPNVQPSGGGLVTALVPILRQSGGCWVGSTGTDRDNRVEEALRVWSATRNHCFAPVFMSRAERIAFYNGCSNEIIWPLFHCLPSRCQFNAAYWRGYRHATEKFADVVEQVWEPGDFIWVQDYHLMILGQALRSRGFRERIAYFHHIPFPPPDVFETLPWRVELLRGLMRYDVIGFQTHRDRRNFIACLRHCLSGARLSPGATLGTYPISIDFDEFAGDGGDPAVIEASESIQMNVAGTKILLGVDRLDYTKGILQRLSAFRRLLESRPEWRGRVTFFQIVVPSRDDIAEYQRLRLDIEVLVSKINGEYGIPGWVPVHYFHRSIPRHELVAFYRAASVALVTPLRDGMNLVAKEFCAARADNRGVLVLSEFAGAAEELGHGALLVNPNDVEAVASAIHSALTMDESASRRRMEMMRSIVRRHDVFRWARSFIRHHPAAGIEEAPAARIEPDLQTGTTILPQSRRAGCVSC
jgi:trehalose 6-phosphate synthase